MAGRLRAVEPGKSNPAPRVRTGVVGTGSLGKEHARLYAELAALGLCDFVGIYDNSPENAQRVAAKLGVKVFPSIDALAADADALSVVTPTITHHDIARNLLLQGRHVLVEKPMTERTEQAAELVHLAREKNLTLQVGHVERFCRIASKSARVLSRLMR